MAWLYLPEVGDSNSDSLLPSENITDQSPTLKGKQRPLQSWQRTWNEGGWIRLLSGMTLQPSQAMSLAHSWITSTLSQQDSLANRGQSQDSEKEPMTNDGSGLLSSDWFAKYDHEASSWRTSQVSFMEELSTFSETWPRSGSMRSGFAYKRPTFKHPTDEKEFLSWPTPDTMPEAPNSSANVKIRPTSLLKTAIWALEQAVWLTPSANEDAAGTLDGNMQRMLSHQVQEIARHGGIFSKNVQTSHLRLNSKFVEWLMGWPEGWLETTDSESSATE